MKGWNAVPPDLRAPLPNLIHLCFDLMVGIGIGLVVLGAWQAWFAKFRHRLLMTRWFLVPAALAGVGAVVAMESGWIVTEVGRQPWVVYGLMRTSDAATPSSGVPVTLGIVLALYFVLTFVVIGVPWLMGRRWRREEPEGTAQEHGGEPPWPPPEMAGRDEADPAEHDTAGRDLVGRGSHS